MSMISLHILKQHSSPQHQQGRIQCQRCPTEPCPTSRRSRLRGIGKRGKDSHQSRSLRQNRGQHADIISRSLKTPSHFNKLSM